jgi:ankyrin repeat protein
VLTLFAASGHEDLVLDLIKAGADVNQVHAGILSSPLAHALKGDHVPTARALLAAGAHLDADDANGPVLRMLAASCSPKALSFILSRPTPPSPDHANAALLLASGVKGCPHTAAIITSLLAVGATASAVADQRSALMRAAESGSADAFQVLMQAGANLSSTSADGANVFVIALMERNEAVLRLLRPHVTAAMANPRSDSGQPALVAVASEGDADTLLALLSHGARASDAGEDGVTVAHALAAAGAAEALEKVLEYVKEGSGGTCTPGTASAGTGKPSCVDEIRSMVAARELQHGGWRPAALPFSRHSSFQSQA